MISFSSDLIKALNKLLNLESRLLLTNWDILRNSFLFLNELIKITKTWVAKILIPDQFGHRLY